MLDVGCGTAGHVGRLVADQGARVTGVDLSARSMALAQRRHPGLRFVAADMRALPFATGACRGIVAFYSLIYTPPVSELVELRRVHAPGGALLLAVHAGEGVQRFDSCQGIPVEVDLHLRSPEVLAGQLRAAGFTVELLEERRRRRPLRRGPRRADRRDSHGRSPGRSTAG